MPLPRVIVALALAELDPQLVPDYSDRGWRICVESDVTIGCSPGIALAKLRVAGHAQRS